MGDPRADLRRQVYACVQAKPGFFHVKKIVRDLSQAGIVAGPITGMAEG